MKLIGIIPARMKASRFPGKPLHTIIDRPMIKHVWGRAKLFDKWDYLAVSSCDDEIIEYCLNNGIEVIKTGSHHTRALDRVEEAVHKIKGIKIDENDIIVNVQGDEPMLHPEMFECLVDPIKNKSGIGATILAMEIKSESLWRNPDTVKIIHNNIGEVLYTSRSPIPYNENKFTEDFSPKRIYGIFAFQWKLLKKFSSHSQTQLELLEACDSNRILDMDFSQFIATYPYFESFSVDSPSDILKVEKAIINDKYWGKY